MTVPVSTRRQVLTAMGGLAVVSVVSADQSAEGAQAPLHRRCSFGAYVSNEPYGSAPAGLGEHYALERTLGVKLQRMVWYADMSAPWPTAAAAQAASESPVAQLKNCQWVDVGSPHAAPRRAPAHRRTVSRRE